MPEVVFREAVSPEELEQVHRLNHQVFAEEVHQHAAHPSGILIDKFHHRNRYFVGLRDQQVVAMVSAHHGPEFSVTSRCRIRRSCISFHVHLRFDFWQSLPASAVARL